MIIKPYFMNYKEYYEEKIDEKGNVTYIVKDDAPTKVKQSILEYIQMIKKAKREGIDL